MPPPDVALAFSSVLGCGFRMAIRAQHRLILLVVTGDKEHDGGKGIAGEAAEEHTQ